MSRRILIIIVVVLLVLFIVTSVFLFVKRKNTDSILYRENNSKKTLQYKNISQGFTLEYPSELSYKDTDEGDTTHTIVFTDNIGEKTFQIFFTPYYGNQITSSRIEKDIPGGQYTTPVEIVIHGNIHAIAFFSTLDIGEMREVWFLYDGYLYQVTAPKELDEWLAKIMETWEFYQVTPAGIR